MVNTDEIKDLVSRLSEPQWKELYLEHGRGSRVDVVPFPGEELQRVTNGQAGEATARGAISILDCIMSCVGEVYPTIDATRKLKALDYGCGWGRMTRLLPYYFDVDGVAGVDPEPRLVGSAKELVPFLDHRVIMSMEALPFGDASFDVVFANSVFSHLSERSAVFTLGELSRVLADGGMLVVSTLEQDNMEKFYANDAQREWITNILGRREDAIARLEETGFVWGDTGRWPDYGIAITEDRWIAMRFEENGVDFGGSKRGAHAGTQNYKYGVRRPRAGT